MAKEKIELADIKEVKKGTSNIKSIKDSLGHLCRAMMFQYISVIIYIVGFIFLMAKNYVFATIVFGLSFIIIIVKIVFDIKFIGSVFKNE